MRQVKCVSPHGGAHHGTNGRGNLVGPGWTGTRQLQPNPGGYITNTALGTVAVGSTVDAPEPPAFIADGFHFVDAATGLGDECTTPGPGCWCGQHKAGPPAADPPPAAPAALAKPAPASAEGAK